MQSSTRANLEENYRYHARLAEYHKQRVEHAGGSGDSVAGAMSESTTTTEGEAPPPARGRTASTTTSTRVAPRDPSVTLSRDQALFDLHNEVANQLRSALDNWQDAPSADAMKADRPVTRNTRSAMARSIATTRH